MIKRFKDSSFGKEKRGKNENLNEAFHPEEREAIAAEEEERVEKLVDLAVDCRAGAAGRREGLEHEALAIPHAEPRGIGRRGGGGVGVGIVLGGLGLPLESEEGGEANGVEVLGVDDRGTGLEIVAADGDRGHASAHPAAPLEDPNVVEAKAAFFGACVPFEEIRDRGAADAAPNDADAWGGKGAGGR